MKLSDVLSDESKWCQGVYCRDENGLPVPSGSPEAVSFCLMEALFRCLGEDNWEATKLMMDIIEAAFGRAPRSFNDDPTTTFADIQRVCREFDEKWGARCSAPQ